MFDTHYHDMLHKFNARDKEDHARRFAEAKKASEERNRRSSTNKR